MSDKDRLDESLRELRQIIPAGNDIDTLPAQLIADAEQVKLHGGDQKAIAKCLLQAADRIAELEAESAGRLRELNRKAEEARTEWIRAEAAEAALERVRVLVSAGYIDIDDLAAIFAGEEPK